MGTFSPQSQAKLSTCHEDLQTIFNEVVKTFDCSILVGFRNQAEQEEAFQAGKTQDHWPDSKHNSEPSMAVDVSPFPIDWENKERFYYFAGYVMKTAEVLKEKNKISHSLRWGGDWSKKLESDNDKSNLHDLDHFELY